MAKRDLIDDYLWELRHRIRWRSDADEVIAEMEDHLRTAVEDLERGGVLEADAQSDVLDRFGEPALVAREVATTPSGTIAAPTESTRTAGAAAMVSASAWVGLLALWSATAIMSERGKDWETTETVLFIAGVGCLFAAIGTSVMAWLGLRNRLGGLGTVGLLGAVICALALPAALIPWFTFGWQGLLAAGSALIAVAALRSGYGHRRAIFVAGFSWVMALGTWAALRSAEVGPVDEWGDYPVAFVGGLAVGCLGSAVGMLAIGRWLHREPPADLTLATNLANT